MSPEPALGQRRELTICGVCHDLGGQTTPNREPTFRHPTVRYQECLCEQAVPWAPGHCRPDTTPETNPYWETQGYRQPSKFLCRTCAAAVLEDSSRWTVWHCRDCKPRIVELNSRAGRLVVVFGKHSIVNDSSIKTRAIPRADPDHLHSRLMEISAGYEVLGRWVREQTVRNLVHLGLPLDEDLPLRLYLRELQARPIDKEAAFDRLVLFLECLAAGRDGPEAWASSRKGLNQRQQPGRPQP